MRSNDSERGQSNAVVLQPPQRSFRWNSPLIVNSFWPGCLANPGLVLELYLRPSGNKRVNKRIQFGYRGFAERYQGYQCGKPLPCPQAAVASRGPDSSMLTSF